MEGMTDNKTPIHNLKRRAVISVEGPDAHDLLQRVLTVDLTGLEIGAIRAGALLTPQGKILSDFLVHGVENGVFLDIHAGAADALVKRLSMYRLRADAQIARRDELRVIVGKGAADPRHTDLPARMVVSPHDAPETSDDAAQDTAEITAGVPAFGRDYDEAQVFPTDVNLDLYGGIGWKKGCFIGQEVVSRMKRRGTIRKRSLAVSCDGEAPHPGSKVMAGETPLGEITSASGSHAIALIRTDRLAAADGDVTVEARVAVIEPLDEH